MMIDWGMIRFPTHVPKLNARRRCLTALYAHWPDQKRLELHHPKAGRDRVVFVRQAHLGA
jgi:hypothetical protein